MKTRTCFIHRPYALLAALALGLTVTLFLILTFGPSARAAGVIYVNADATGAGTGLSWTAAFTEVQSALVVAVNGDEIWVAQGVYYPDYDPTSGAYTGQPTATFVLTDGVSLYGGFAGHETSRDQRDWSTYWTVLNGDIDRNDINNDGNFVAETWKDIVGENAYYVVTSRGVDRSAVLDGFIITGGRSRPYPASVDGGGMRNSNRSSPTLINLVFSGNMAIMGGGMRNEDSNPLLINVIFSGNYAGWGGGMSSVSSSPVLPCPELINVVFNGNTASGGGGMEISNCGCQLTNVTFANNVALSFGGGAMRDDYGYTTVRNSIFWNNKPDQFRSFTSVTYSIVQGGYAGTGNIDADPQFIDIDGPDNIPGTLDDDLRLSHRSPAIDAGNNSSLPADVTDLDGDGDTTEPIPLDLDGLPRFVDMPGVLDTGNGAVPIVDMGAYERSGDLWIAKRVSPAALSPGEPMTYTLAFANDGFDTVTGVIITDVLPLGQIENVSYTIESDVAITLKPDTTYVWQVADLPPGAGGVITITGWVRSLLATPFDIANTASITTTSVETNTTDNQSTAITHVKGVLYVDADATGAKTGSSWQDAFTELQSALAAAGFGDQIWVAEGTYKPDYDPVSESHTGNRTDTFQLRNGVALYGGFSGDETSLDQRDWVAHQTILSGEIGGASNTDNTFHVVTGHHTDATAMLDGFIVTRGAANDNSDSSRHYHIGGGMYTVFGSPIVRNVWFKNNTAISGGGMFNNFGKATLINVTFTNNVARSGAGMSNESSDGLTLINAIFSGNSADYTGGGMHNYDSDVRLVHVVFSGNSASRGGGMNNYQSKQAFNY